MSLNRQWHNWFSKRTIVSADPEIRNQWGTISEPQPVWILGLERCKHSQAKNLQFQAIMPASADKWNKWNTIRCKWMIYNGKTGCDWLSERCQNGTFLLCGRAVVVVHSTRALQVRCAVYVFVFFFWGICYISEFKISQTRTHNFARQLSISDSNAR